MVVVRCVSATVNILYSDNIDLSVMFSNYVLFSVKLILCMFFKRLTETNI